MREPLNFFLLILVCSLPLMLIRSKTYSKKSVHYLQNMTKTKTTKKLLLISCGFISSLLLSLSSSLILTLLFPNFKWNRFLFVYLLNFALSFSHPLSTLSLLLFGLSLVLSLMALLVNLQGWFPLSSFGNQQSFCLCYSNLKKQTKTKQ